jgi:hypothetical protein
MVDKRFLEMMYQQWIQGNEFYASRWLDFAQLAANHNRTTTEEILKILDTCLWFKK